MSKLVIRKRVTLEFLGDEYKEAYLDFKSIPVGDYDTLAKKINSAGKASNKSANMAILEILKNYYLGGKFPDAEGKLESLDSADELDGLDKDSLLECFGKMTGQDIKGALETKLDIATNGGSQEEIDAVQVDADPKSDTPSKPGSTVENQPQ